MKLNKRIPTLTRDQADFQEEQGSDGLQRTLADNLEEAKASRSPRLPGPPPPESPTHGSQLWRVLPGAVQIVNTRAQPIEICPYPIPLM